MISYDPDKKPDIPSNLLKYAKENNLHLVPIICLENEDSNEGCVSFISVSYSMPRIGEKIQLEDNKICKIIDVLHKVGTHDDEDMKFTLLVPNVIAKMIN